jgi:hypothetical protein
VILYECLTGRRPFRGDSKEEIREQILTRDPKPLRQLDDTIPPRRWMNCACIACGEIFPNVCRRRCDFQQQLAQVTTQKQKPALRWGLAIGGAAVVLFGVIALASSGWFGGGASQDKPVSTVPNPDEVVPAQPTCSARKPRELVVETVDTQSS